jgi:uncharacterized protein GlcG (DUF336 family)
MKLTCFNVLAFTAVLSASAFAQGLPTQKVITLDVAKTIAEGVMEKCHSSGYKITVQVVDSANTLMVLLRDEGTRASTIDMGRMKINTVIATGRASGPSNRPPGDPGAPPVLPGTTPALGGVPIMAGTQLIGAIAVSGAPGADKDAACVEAGLAKVADKLK